MVKCVKAKCEHKCYNYCVAWDEIEICEIEFSDLSFIKNLSKDCFGIIKQFCGKYWLDTVFNQDYNWDDENDSDCENINDYEKCIFACENNIIYNGIDSDIDINYMYELYVIAVKDDSVDTFCYICEVNIKLSNSRWFKIACVNASINILKLMKDKITRKMSEWYYNFGFKIMCKKGHVDILSLMWSKCVYTEKDLGDCYKIAVEHHQLSIVIWLNKVISNNKMYKLLEGYPGISWACENGNLDVIKWTNDNYPNIVHDAIEHNKYNEFDYLCEYSHVNILEWMKNKYPKLIEKHKLCFLIFLRDNEELESDSESDSENAPPGDPLKTQIWIECEFTNTYNGFQKACDTKNTQTLTWMKNKYPNIIIKAFEHNECEAFNEVIWNNDNIIFNWLKHELPNLVTSHVI